MQYQIPSKSSENGFSLVEVMVAILITTVFLVAGMQSFVSAVAFKTQARRTAQVTAWAQENMELIRQRAADQAQIPFTSQALTAPVVANAMTILVGSTAGFRVGDSIVVGNDSVSNRVFSLSSTQITLASALATPQRVGSFAIARCRADTSDAGFAAYLNANLPNVTSDTNNDGNPAVGQKTIFGRQYSLTRTTGIRNASPYQVATINYRVVDDTNRQVVNLSSEVVPNAFFQCP
jgi:prepilin-type N-terminal cleavage/methylation domain-containing protein